MAQIDFGHALGDHVYTIVYSVSPGPERICPSCAGVSTNITHNGINYVCDTCCGMGVVAEPDYEYIIAEAIITDCIATLDGKEVFRTYGLDFVDVDMGPDFTREKNLYSTREAAQAAIDQIEGTANDNDDA